MFQICGGNRFLCSAICLLVFVMLSGCAPLHIKEHQADGVGGRCGFGSSAKFFEHSPLSVEVLQDKQELFILVYLRGLDGQILSVLKPYLVIRRAGKRLELPIEMKVSQVQRADPRIEPREASWKINDPYRFTSDKTYGTGSVSLTAHIPFDKDDIEIETPLIRINDRVIEPVRVKFKFVDRWTMTPLNGC